MTPTPTPPGAGVASRGQRQRCRVTWPHKLHLHQHPQPPQYPQEPVLRRAGNADGEVRVVRPVQLADWLVVRNVRGGGRGRG